MSENKKTRRISLSVPADDYEQFKWEQEKMLSELATSLGSGDAKIGSKLYRALVKNFNLLDSPQKFSDLSMKAQLQPGRIYVAFWMER